MKGFAEGDFPDSPGRKTILKMPLRVCHSPLCCLLNGFGIRAKGGAEQRREEEREGAELPSLFIWFSRSAPLSSVVLGGWGGGAKVLTAISEV